MDKVDKLQMECIQEYAQATGRTVKDCLGEALDDWIRTVASTISQNEKYNLITFPGMMRPLKDTEIN